MPKNGIMNFMNGPYIDKRERKGTRRRGGRRKSATKREYCGSQGHKTKIPREE